MSAPSKGFESLIHLLDSLEQTSSERSNKEDGDIEQVNEVCVDSIKANIESTKAELKAKGEQLEGLKAVLARKKLSNQRRLDKVKREWQENCNDSFIEFQRKEEEINTLHKKAKTDVESLKRRLTDEYARIHQIVSSRDETCQKYSYTLEQNYLDTIQQWKVLEKQRLEQMAREKAAAMKEEAAKALEPELRKIVEDHKKQLVQLKQENDSKLSLITERLTKQYDDSFRVIQQSLKVEQESIYLEMETKYKEQLEKQALQYEKAVERLSESMHLEKEDMKKEHFAKMQLLTKQQREEVQDWAKHHETLLKSIHAENQHRLEAFTANLKADWDEFQSTMERDLKKWEIEEDNRLESLHRDRLEDETQQLKRENNKKIEMIKVKLKENLETTKFKISSQLEKEREDIESTNATEVKHTLRRLNETSNIDLSKLSKLKTELQREKDKLFDIESAVALRTDALEKSKNERNMKESEKIKSLEDQLLVITSAEEELEKKKKIIENKILANKKLFEDAVVKRTIETNREIALINNKFNALLKNKEDVLEHRKKVLSELMKESKNIDDEIQKLKKRLLC